MKTSKKYNVIFIITAIVIGLFLLSQTTLASETVEELNTQIDAIKNRIAELQKQQAIYQKNIRQKQEEAMSLKNQLEIIDNQLAETDLQLKTTTEEIQKVNLEVRQTEIEIINKGDQIDDKKDKLGEVLQNIYLESNSSALEVLILHQSLSEYFIKVENEKILSQTLKKSLQTLKTLKDELTDKKEQLDTQHEELAKLKAQLVAEKDDLLGQNEFKSILLTQTKKSEQKFYNLFWQAKQEQQQANSEITNLEKLVRERLAKNQTAQKELADATLIWPVDSRRVTATFHDPDYPFRYIMEHPAIDIATPQGTPLRAAADGYVLKAKDAGMGYSYIALLHGDNLSTVYGHVSKIYVKQDEYVTKGEIIGLSGAKPGTPGAGPMTTGPHLHLEVRLNGIPVDPRLYLP
jgi:murein DD-endopeptidase MepM/ murein hydrolase activator NlpD